jgi:hypothetical protein
MWFFSEETADLARDLAIIAKDIDTLIDHLPGAHISYEDQVSNITSAQS